MANDSGCEIIEHTADLGVRVSAENREDLFAKAASGILAYAVPESKEKLLLNPELEIEERVFVIEEENLEELLLHWLNEQIYNLYTHNILAIDYSLMIEDSPKLKLSAKIRCIKISPEYISSEVKAATRHNLKIEKASAGYKAEVVFDL